MKLKSILNENDAIKVANELVKIAGFSEDKADSVVSGFNTSATLSLKNKYRKFVKHNKYKDAARLIKKYYLGK